MYDSKRRFGSIWYNNFWWSQLAWVPNNFPWWKSSKFGLCVLDMNSWSFTTPHPWPATSSKWIKEIREFNLPVRTNHNLSIHHSLSTSSMALCCIVASLWKVTSASEPSSIPSLWAPMADASAAVRNFELRATWACSAQFQVTDSVRVGLSHHKLNGTSYNRCVNRYWRGDHPPMWVWNPNYLAISCCFYLTTFHCYRALVADFNPSCSFTERSITKRIVFTVRRYILNKTAMQSIRMDAVNPNLYIGVLCQRHISKQIGKVKSWDPTYLSAQILVIHWWVQSSECMLSS